MADKIYIDRPPRIEPELPSGSYNIPNPPDTELDAGRLLQEAFLPMIMVMGYFLATIFGQGRNMLMMIPMLLSIFGAVMLAIYTHIQEQKKIDEAKAAYKRRISELRLKMESEHEQQRIYYFYNYPDPEKQAGQNSHDIVMAQHAQYNLRFLLIDSLHKTENLQQFTGKTFGFSGNADNSYIFRKIFSVWRIFIGI